MLDTGRGGHHEEVQTLTARGQGPGLNGWESAATGGPAAAAQGPTAGGSSAGRTTVRQEEDMGNKEGGERDKTWRKEIRVGRIGKDMKRKQKKERNEKGSGESRRKTQEDRR